MSKIFKFALEEIQEPVVDAVDDTRTPEEVELENQRISLELEVDEQEIGREFELVEGLESLRFIASKIGTPSPTEVALFKVAANMAVAGTKNNAKDYLPSMESNKAIALEGFGEKIVEVVKKIIAKIKEYWEKAKNLLNGFFNKSAIVEKQAIALKEKCKEKVEELKEVEIVAVKTTEPYDIFKQDKTLLLEHSPKKPEENHQKKVYLIPEEINIYNENSIIFPYNNAPLGVYMNQGSYLEELFIFLDKYNDNVDNGKKGILSSFSALDANVQLLNSSLDHYLESKLKGIKPEYTFEELNSSLDKIKLNKKDMLMKFLSKIGNPYLLSEINNTGFSYTAEISGGHGFITRIQDKEIIDIRFHKDTKQSGDHYENKCKIKIGYSFTSKLSNFATNISNNIFEFNRANHSFYKSIEHKLEDFKNKTNTLLERILKETEPDANMYKIVIEVQKIYDSVMNFKNALINYDNYYITAMHEINKNYFRIVDLHKAYYD